MESCTPYVTIFFLQLGSASILAIDLLDIVEINEMLMKLYCCIGFIDNDSVTLS